MKRRSLTGAVSGTLEVRGRRRGDLYWRRLCRQREARGLVPCRAFGLGSTCVSRRSVGAVNVCRCVPATVRLIEWLAAFPDREHRMQQLAYDMADGDRPLLGMLGNHAQVERPGRRVTGHGAQGGHPQVAAHQVVAARRHDLAFRAARFAVAIGATRHFDRQRAEILDQLVGRLEAVDV
jgi:hypothetical protein